MLSRSDIQPEIVHSVSANGVCLSPSLLSPVGAANSYELKFLIPDPVAEQVEQWAQQHLAFDPHADAALGNAYRIHSLYLDTPGLDIYRRTPSFRRRKFRLRRYGTERGLYLERKTKSGERVRKRRTLIADTELTHLQNGASDPEWAGYWFHRRLHTRGLQPTCQITYDRVAHVGQSDEGPLRLTLDRRIHCAPEREWCVAEPRGGLHLLSGQVVLELKYRTVLPGLFKRFIQEFNLSPKPASKYRLSVEAWSMGGPDCQSGHDGRIKDGSSSNRGKRLPSLPLPLDTGGLGGVAGRF